MTLYLPVENIDSRTTKGNNKGDNDLSEDVETNVTNVVKFYCSKNMKKNIK